MAHERAGGRRKGRLALLPAGIGAEPGNVHLLLWRELGRASFAALQPAHPSPLEGIRVFPILHPILALPRRDVPDQLRELERFARGGSQASIDRSSSIPRSSAKRAKSAIEASTMRSARETTQVRRRNRASQ